MKHLFSVCVSTIIVGLVAAPPQVRAGGNGGAVAAGIIGGLAAGAIIGGAVARGPYDGPVYAPSYAPAPIYATPPQTCVQQQQIWSDRYQGYVVRNVRVPCY